MRTLNLKGMSWIMALAMMFIVSFTSCSDDKEEGATTPVFPEEQAISCNAGETKVLTFDANMTWQLSSTAAIWCKFEVNGEDKEVVKGEAGKQSITIKVTDAAQEIGKTSEAQLKLDMGGETKVIATVTRSAKGYSLKIYDAEGNEITTEQGLEVGYKKQISFTVKANFRFAATSFPEWVILDGGSMAGEVNDKEEGELKIQATNGLTVKENGEYEKWPVEAGKDSKNVITFADEAGNASFSFPVFFKGMGAEDINITEPVISSRYGWNVSLDGKTFKLAGSMDGGENVITFNDKMEFTVVSLKDEYEVVLLDTYKGVSGKKQIEEMSEQWVKYTYEKGKVTLTVTEFSDYYPGYNESRECYALVIPKAQYEQIKEDIVGNLVTVNEEGDQDLVYAYGQNNLLINFVQKEEKAAEEEAFDIKNGAYEPIDYTKEEDQSILNMLTEYGITEVYSISANAGDRLIIDPMLSAEKWQGSAIAVDAQDNSITFDYEFSMTGDETRFYIMTEMPASFTEKMIIIFRNSEQYINYKALVINPIADGNDQTQRFTVTGGTLSDYTEANAETLKTAHGLTGIHKAAGENMKIKMTPSSIKSFDVFETDGSTTSIATTVEEDILWATDPMTGNSITDTVNAYFGSYGNIATRTLLIVVTCEDNSKYGIVVSSN